MEAQLIGADALTAGARGHAMFLRSEAETSGAISPAFYAGRLQERAEEI
jgi:hypothetical protein